MKRLLATIMSVMALIAFVPMADAAAPCPPEVSKAKELLNQKSAQAPRSLAGARGQDVQVPRGQDVQTPRGQDAQTPRGQATQDRTGGRGEDVQAPRGQDAQTPRGQDVQTPRSLAGAKPSGDISKASTLIKEAEAACKAGDMKTAKSKAEAAIATLK